MPQARGSGSNGGTTHNTYVAFFFCMDENSDTDIGLNEVVVPKNKQGTYVSKDYFPNSELSTAPLSPQFSIASHFINVHDGKTDSINQTKEPESGALNMTSWMFLWWIQTEIRMLQTQLLCRMITNEICFCTGIFSPLKTFAYGNIGYIRDVVEIIKWAVLGSSLVCCNCWPLRESWLKV